MTDWQEGDIHEDDEYVVVDEEESDSEDDEDYSDGDEDESEDDIEDFDYEGELIDEDEDEEGLLSSSKGFFFRKLAVLGDSPLALVVSFAVLLLAVGFSFWLEEMGASSNDITATTTTTRRPTSRPKRNNTLQRIKEQERMWEEKYQELGPAPEIGPPKVFHVQEDSLESIREAYAKDGVVALRGLISDQLWQRLDKESQELIAREELANQKPRPRLPNGPDGPKKSKGKKAQFHTQKTFAAFFEAPTVAQDDDTGDLKIVNSSAFFEVAALSEVSKFGSKLMMPELKEEETVRMLR